MWAPTWCCRFCRSCASSSAGRGCAGQHRRGASRPRAGRLDLAAAVPAGRRVTGRFLVCRGGFAAGSASSPPPRWGSVLERLALVPLPRSTGNRRGGHPARRLRHRGDRGGPCRSRRRWRAQLAARARQRGSVLMPFVANPWEGADVTLTPEKSTWHGLGWGKGKAVQPRADRLRPRPRLGGTPAPQHLLAAGPARAPARGATADPAFRGAIRPAGEDGGWGCQTARRPGGFRLHATAAHPCLDVWCRRRRPELLQRRPAGASRILRSTTREAH